MLGEWIARLMNLLFKKNSEIAQKHEHDIVRDAYAPATCTAPGLTEGTHCRTCGMVLVPQEEISPVGHVSVVDEGIKPTCTEPGKTEGSHCSVCGEVLISQEEVPVLGHEVVIDETVKATCASTGLTEGSHCRICGEVLKRQEEIPALGHHVVIDAAVPATCTVFGLTEGAHCSVCGEVLRPQEIIPALDHNVVVDEAIPATYANTGLTEGSHCSICGEVLVPQEEVPMLRKIDAPIPDENDGKASMHPAAGHIKRDEVSLVQRSSKVPAKHLPARAYRGRTDIYSVDLPDETTHIDDAAFEGCIALRSLVIPENVRSIGEGAFKNCTALEKIELPSTLREIPKSCFANCINLRTVVTGTELRSVKMSAFQRCHSLRHLALPSCCWEISPSAFMGCKREQITLHVVQGSFAGEYAKKHGFIIDEYATIENYYKQETGAAGNAIMMPCATGHVEVTDPPVPATCVDMGWTSERHCAVCGIIMTPRLPIPALGHDAEAISPVPASCTSEGKTAGSRCRRCGEVLQEQKTIPALGHDAEIMPAVAATCNTEGSATWGRCRRCGMVLNEKIVIPALGHDVETIPGWPATRTSPGMTEGTKCRRCGRILTEQTVIPNLREPSTAADRLKVLTSKPAADWPLNRILAFGATAQEYKALQDRFADDFLANLDVLGSPKCRESDRKWVSRLGEDAWDRAVKLCSAITRIGVEHSDGLRIARRRLMGAKDDQIARLLQCSPKELRREYNGYVNAVTDLFRRHSQAFDFMYPHGSFDSNIAETFFGATTYDRIERCCDIVRIHELRGERQTKPVGLPASLKTEASNRRTKVLTDWEHLRNYIIEQFDSQPILGSIELDEKEYQMLIDYLRRTYMTKAHSYTGMDVDKVVCVALVQIALRCTGTAYWPVVAEDLGIAHTAEINTALGKCFLRTMKHFKKATYAASEYVASIKLHAFVVNAYIGRLFDFLYAYYELDLGRNLEFANMEELRLLIISGEYFSRKQMLLQQTIDALKLIPEASLNRLKTYLGWIDSAFWQQGWQPDHEDRFSRAFKEWCANKDEFTGKWTASDSIRRRGKRMHSRPTLSLDVRNGQLNLILPVQRLPFDCDDQAGWRIIDGDGRQYNLVCTLVESITGCRTDELTQEISKKGLLSEITMEFYNGNRTIRSYTIPGDCVRMFNSQGLLVTGKRVPAGRVYFLTQPNTSVETESDGIQQKFGPWNLQVIEMQEGETVIFPDDTLAVVGSDTTEGVCGGHPITGAIVRRKDSDARYQVYGQFPSFLLKVTEEQFAKTRFQINDRYLAAKEVRCRRLTLHERTTDTGYLVTMPAPREAFHLCHININVPGGGHVRDWTFCYWPNFAYSFDNGKCALPYWDSPRGAVRVNTPIPMRGEDVEKNPNGSGEYGFLIHAEPKPLSLDFDWGGSVWTLELEVPALAWRRGDEPWLMTPLGEIWHKDFPSEIDIRTQASEVWMYVDRDGLQGGQSVSFKRRRDEFFVHCDMLALRQWFTRDRIMHSVHIHIDDKDFSFASVYCRSYLASGRLEAHYANSELHGSFEIIGKGNYSVTLLHEQQEILTQVPVVDGTFTAQAPLKSGLYSAIVYEEVEDEFGFDVTWDEIGREDVKLLNPGDLTGASMTVKQLDTLNEQPEELGLRTGCYRVRLTGRAEGDGVAYIGKLQDTSESLGKELLVFVEYPNLDAIDHCRIHFLEDDEWLTFLYDYSQKRIVTQENRKMPFMERYRRYVALVPEDTFTVVYETQ